MISIRRV